MTNEELIIQVTSNTKDIKQMNERLNKVENKTDVIMEIAKNVEKLAINMEYMAKEQKDIKDRLTTLEQEPALEYKNIKRVVITCIITAVVGGLIGALLTLLLK